VEFLGNCLGGSSRRAASGRSLVNLGSHLQPGLTASASRLPGQTAELRRLALELLVRFLEGGNARGVRAHYLLYGLLKAGFEEQRVVADELGNWEAAQDITVDAAARRRFDQQREALKAPVQFGEGTLDRVQATSLDGMAAKGDEVHHL
jgi:hypothetical protein